MGHRPKMENMERLKGKKVIVTGGTGFIGSHLVEALVNLGAKVFVIDIVCDPSSYFARQRLDKKVHLVSYFNEVKRGDKFLTKEEFEIEKTKQLINLDCHAFGGESGIEALARFKEGVKWVVSQNQGKTILIVTHGTVLNIYFADLLNIHEGLLGRWQKAAFCAYGIVENGKVVKDII